MDSTNENDPKDIVSESIFELSSDGSFSVTDEVRQSYWKHGFIIIRGILSEEEASIIEKGWTEDPYIQDKKYENSDDVGETMWLAVWNDAAMDATGLLSRSQKLAGTIEQLHGEEVYHYHGKYLCKPPKTGGSFVWHQDYGYWYYNGNLFPDDMCTAFFAVDDINMENGCLKVIPGSHRCGRLDHSKHADQAKADLERVEHYKQKLGIRQVVLNRGDAIIFHVNILHRSDKNESDKRRLALAIAYNTKRNNPIKKHHRPFYNKLDKVDNGALLEWGKTMNWDADKKYYDTKTTKAHMDVIEGKKN